MSACSPARFDGAIRAAHEKVQSGVIGEVLSARAMVAHGPFGKDTLFKDSPEFDEGQGGPELSLGFYVADLLRWFIAEDAVRVYAEYANLNTPWSPYMDSGKATVSFAHNKLGSMDVYFSTSHPGPLWEIEVMGTKGRLRTAQNGYEGIVWIPGETQAFYRSQNAILRDELEAFVRACIQGVIPDLSIEEARQAMELCFAWRRSAESHMPVALPLE